MSEGDPATKKSGVPSWQLKTSDSTKEAMSDSGKNPPQETSSRSSIIEKARKFLEEDEVRNSSTDKQIAFLEGKGLTSDEIESLLGISRNTEATHVQQDTSTPSPPKSDIPATSQPPASSQYSSTARDSPPIITYPEFLTTSTQPAPLITAKRLLTTLYIFGGVSALLYGTSNYLVTPMVASLTESRHNLAESAQTNLDKLIARLSEVVSEIPQPPSSQPYKDDWEGDDSDGDPTEMFHRDIGVQTSLPTTPHESRPSTPVAEVVLSGQTARLNEMTTNIKELNEVSTSEDEQISELSTTIGVLRDYLDDLAYIPSSYKFGGSTGYGSASSKATEESMDEIAKLKAQIRGVKGVLLSARSFPGGGAVRTR